MHPLCVERLLRESFEAMNTDVMAGRAVRGEVGRDFSNDAGELKAVAGTWRDEYYIFHFRVEVKNEVFVRRVREQTAMHRHQRAIGLRKVTGNEPSQHQFVLWMALAIPVVGVHFL